MSNFAQLIQAAESQPQPQRLLFLLAKTETKKQKKSPSSQTGTITPVMCVDKTPAELGQFKELVSEADAINRDWDLMLIAGLNGQNGVAPTTQDAEPLLNKMANDLMQGQALTRYLILDRNENRIEVQS